MPSKSKPPSKRVQTTTSTAAATRQLTRTEAAKAMRCSESTVRRLEGDVLTPIVGDDGVHRFDVAQVVAASFLRSDDLVADRENVGETREMMSKVVSHQTGTIDRLLKHIEVRETTQATAINTVLDAQNGTLRACFERLEKLEHHRAATLEALEGAQQTQRNHELEEKRLELQKWRSEQAIDQLKLVVPHLLQRLVGDNASRLAENTVREMSPDQMRAVIEALSVEQLAVLMELVVSRIDRIAPDGPSETDAVTATKEACP